MKIKKQKTTQIGKNMDKIEYYFSILEKKLNLTQIKLLRVLLVCITKYGLWGRKLCP